MPPRGGKTLPPGGPAWPVVALAAAGFILSAYLTATKLAGSNALFCEAGGGCDIVQSSRYAVFLGLPTAAWGVALFAALGGLALAGLPAGRWRLAFVLSAAGVGFTGYLTYLELFVLRAICGWCVTVAAVAAGALGALIVQRPRGGRRAMTPLRLAALGVPVAALTAVVAAGVYVTGEATGSATYQEALARHLAQSGAIFYGAYW